MAEFTLFPKLCTELRLKIIKFALYQPRVVEYSRFSLGPESRPFTATPPIFHANREMREEAIKHFGLKRDCNGSLNLKSKLLLNYAEDTFLLPYAIERSILVGRISSGSRSRIRSLAVNHLNLTCGREVGDPCMKRIKTIISVFENLEELVVLTVPQRKMIHPEKILECRTWTKEYRRPEEVTKLWEQPSKQQAITGLRNSSHSSTMHEDMAKMLKEQNRSGKKMLKVRISRGAMDENSSRGGVMVFDKEHHIE